MDYVLIIHEIEDYTVWKKIFDEAASIRKHAGEQSYQVLKMQVTQIKSSIFLSGPQLTMPKHFLSHRN